MRPFCLEFLKVPDFEPIARALDPASDIDALDVPETDQGGEVLG
jgi:hypothetical protein